MGGKEWPSALERWCHTPREAIYLRVLPSFLRRVPEVGHVAMNSSDLHVVEQLLVSFDFQRDPWFRNQSISNHGPRTITLTDHNLFLFKNNLYFLCQDDQLWHLRPQRHIWVSCLPPPFFLIDSISFICLAGMHIFSMGNVFTTVNWVHIGIYLLWSLVQRPWTEY